MIATLRIVYKLLLDDASCPLDNFLETVKDKTTRARIVRQIDKVERGNFGNYREFDGIGELKIDLGPGYRVYYGKYGNIVVILLGGGDKKNQQADIENAKTRWEAWRQSTDAALLSSWSEASEKEGGQFVDSETV